MKRFLMIMVLLVGVVISGEAPAATRNSVARIYSGQGKGSGFVVTRNLIMTNHHVVCDDDNVSCNTSVIVQVDTYKVKGKVVAYNKTLDLALVYVHGKLPRPFEFCASARIGDEVENWAWEFGKFRIRRGVIREMWDDNYITTTGIISGNSGSPLLHGNCVIGVTKARGMTNGFGVHTNEFYAKQFLYKYLAGAAVK